MVLSALVLTFLPHALWKILGRQADVKRLLSKNRNTSLETSLSALSNFKNMNLKYRDLSIFIEDLTEMVNTIRQEFEDKLYHLLSHLHYSKKRSQTLVEALKPQLIFLWCHSSFLFHQHLLFSLAVLVLFNGCIFSSMSIKNKAFGLEHWKIR